MLLETGPLRARGRVTQEAVRGSFLAGLSFTVYWNLSVIPQQPQRHHVIRIKKEKGQQELDYHISRMRHAKQAIHQAGYGTMAAHIFKAEWNFAKIIAKRAH